MIQHTNYKVKYEQKIQTFQYLKKTKSCFLKWSQQKLKWQQTALINKCSPNVLQNNQLKVLSFNILFDKLHLLDKKGSMQHVLNSKQRYEFIIKRIGQMEPDIVGLQEVTGCFFDMILQNQQIRRKYWVSNFKSQRLSFGNMLICKIQPIGIQSIKVQRLPRIVETGFFPILNTQTKQTSIVAFSSIHLIALDTNHQIRVIEMKNIIKELKHYEKIVQDFVLQGDMNFHAQFQTETAKNHNLLDAWLEKYKDLKEYPGYTFDSNHNGLINQIYWGFQRRRMRLDRIFYLGNVFQVDKIEVTFDQPIYNQKKKVDKHIFLKGGLLYVTDYFGWNLHKEKENFLFPSDHFGLIATLKLRKDMEVYHQLKN